MKRKAVVRLLAGTLCTATMAGSILPDTAVAYAEGEQQTETVMETEREETKQSEEKPDAEQPAEKPEGTENRENITDPVDNREEAGKDPAAKDTENDIPDSGTVQEDTNVPPREETEETKKEEETVTPEETPKEETEETLSLKEEHTEKKEKEETSKKEKDRDKEDVPEVEIPEEVESNGASTVTVGNETELRNAINGHNGSITIYVKGSIEINKPIIIQRNQNKKDTKNYLKAKQVTIYSSEGGNTRWIYLGYGINPIEKGYDMFKVKEGCSLTFGNNNGGVIKLDGRNISHRGSLVNVEAGGTVTMDGTKLMNNVSLDGHGSGLLNNGTATLRSVLVQGNGFNVGSQYFEKCTNAFGDEKYCVGGGLKNSGIMTVESCTITGNQATCGGGIYTSGSMQNGGYAYTVIRGTTDISGNQVHNYGGKNCARGGGIAVAPKTSETVNCGVLAVYADNGVTSIHDNISEGSAAGVYNNGLCNLYSTQIYKNTAAEHAAVWNGESNGNIVNSIDNAWKAQGSMCMNSVNIYGNISNTKDKAAVTNNGDMRIFGGFIHDNNRIGVSNNGYMCLANAGNNYTQIYLNGRWGQENTGGIRNNHKGTLDIYYASVYSNSGHGITNSGTLNVISGCTGYVSYNTKTGICNNVGATLNIAGSAGISNNGMSGILNGGMMDVSGNLSVEGSQIGLDNTGTAYLRSYGSIKSSGACAVQNVGNAVISGSPEIKSDAAWSVYNLGMMEVSGQPTILGKRPVLNRGTFTNSSKINYGNVEGDTAIRHEAGVLNIAGNSSQDASHDIFLNPMQYATIYGALSRRNILAPSEYELGRKVAEVTYVENSHTVAENSLGLKDTSTGFVLCGCSKINLTEANKKVRGGLNGAALKANDVILSKKYNVTYNSGLPDEINCTMPENRTVYWCEDVTLGGKPQISDKANRYVYQFLGWYDEDGKEYQEGDRICVDGNLVLTAKWELSCNIAYHGNGQTMGDDYTQEKDKSLIISDTEMYKFDGKSYKGLVGEDTFQRTETYKKDENGNLLDKNNKTVTDERRAAKLTSLNPDTGKEEPCEEQYSVKKWGTSEVVQKDESKRFRLNKEYATGKVYDTALQSTNDKGENLCITYDAPDDMVKKGREEKPADKLTLGVKKQDAAVYGASQGKMTSGTWLNMYAVWDKFPQLDAYNRYFTLKQVENGEITTEALLTTLRFKDEEDTDGRYLYSKDYEYNKKENCLIIKGKDGVTLKLRAETDMDSLKETGKSTIRYTLTDSAGNITTKEVECRIVDTSDIQKEYDIYVRFISPKYYKKNGAYVSKENGGLEEHSIWKTDPEYAALLDKAMSNEKRGIQKKSVRVFGVKFEADDPGSGTWDHVEETWEFTHEQVRSVDDFVDEHGYMNYKEKDGLKKFREQYKDCIK